MQYIHFISQNLAETGYLIFL